MKIQLNTILCATDFSDFSNQAISYGIALANEFRSRLMVCHVVDLPSATLYGEYFIDPLEIQQRLEEYATGKLNQLVSDYSIEWEPIIGVGRPAEEITRLADVHNADLVITTTHGRSGLERLILGSVTERLMHTLSCPLLVVHDAGIKKGEPVGFKNILVGCDFSPDSDLAVKYAFSLAQEFEADLFLAHVIDPELFNGMLKAGDEASHDLKQSIKNRLKEQLSSLVPLEACDWCNPRVTLLAGKPHEELAKFAVINDVDLIILGVHGRGFVEKIFVGSTTDRIVRTSSCTVMLVRPTDQESRA